MVISVLYPNAKVAYRLRRLYMETYGFNHMVISVPYPNAKVAYWLRRLRKSTLGRGRLRVRFFATVHVQPSGRKFPTDIPSLQRETRK